jgi:hypothetical protein
MRKGGRQSGKRQKHRNEERNDMSNRGGKDPEETGSKGIGPNENGLEGMMMQRR